eukprot:CAMPEP_0176002050 /NCGR_PEP_ID=MMETSP0120_2-20121206/445_1 /TAXON_ID=160619 /ORGANISM="Kryptoperidinium foliaceum, Strain CCMP 1326" /LENGTH=192 /DNA_ID=CAMNT_0017334623 /DNA_START=165 /DNA_END=740 /DNA_ORIENTATION=+
MHRSSLLRFLFLFFIGVVLPCEALLEQTSTPPLLSTPTYSLATFNKDGTTNMNICTYASPVSITPHRIWCLGLYQETLTEENIQRSPFGVLQLLTEDHADLVSVLGGTSGRDIDKKEACARLGFEWERNDDMEGIELLPGCSSYLYLQIQGGLVDAGSHLIAPYCRILSMWRDPKGTSPQLSTGRLRELGII